MTSAQIAEMRERQAVTAGAVPMVEFWLAEIALQLAQVVELRRFECGLDEAGAAATTDEMEATMRPPAPDDDAGNRGSNRKRYLVLHPETIDGVVREFDSFTEAEGCLGTLGPDYRLLDGHARMFEGLYYYNLQERRARLVAE
jgi:hypothetical protein